MFPCMSPEGARGAIAWCVGQRIFDGIAAGRFTGGCGRKPVVVRPTAQSAIDAVCARARRRAA